MHNENQPRGNVIACIDVGSNATRLRIFRTDKPGAVPREIHRRRFPVQLGRGTFTDGRLREDDILALEKAIIDAVSLARDWNATATVAVATSAVREASNREQFLTRIHTATGIHVRLIDGAEEARLMALGAVADPDGSIRKPNSTAALYVIDIGGGSTEIVRLNDPGDNVISHASLELGAVRLVRQWHLRAPVSADQIAQATERVTTLARSRMQTLEAMLPDATPRNALALGLGGTPGALTRILATESFDPETGISRHKIDHTLKLIAAQNPSALANQYSLEPSRAELILGGAIILLSMMNLLAINTMIPTDRGLCEGLAVLGPDGTRECTKP